MTPQQAADVILQSGGTQIEVLFRKRSNGEMRFMRASTDLAGLVKGGKAAYDARSKNLLVVRDCDLQEIRSIGIEGIARVKIGTCWFHVRPTPTENHHE
jgi:hypothetical protein